MLEIEGLVELLMEKRLAPKDELMRKIEKMRAKIGRWVFICEYDGTSKNR